MTDENPRQVHPNTQRFHEIDFFSSLETNLIDEALAKAQTRFTEIQKSAKNPAFKDKPYATLNDVLKAVRPALNEQGILLTQPPVGLSGDLVKVLTMVRIKGQFHACLMTMKMEKANAHGVGGALTYCKRYSLEGLLGVTGDEDDDGNGAAGISGDAGKAKTHSGPKPRVEGKAALPPPVPKGSEAKPPPITAPAPQSLMDQISELADQKSIFAQDLEHLTIEGYGFKGEKVPTWIANEILDLLKREDVSQAVIMDQVQRVKERRELKAKGLAVKK